MQKWEYKIIYFNVSATDKMIKKLDEVGNYGWEAYAVHVYHGTTIYLKREKRY